MDVIEIGTRVNHYWCGDGIVIDRIENYYQIEWDSGLTNEDITGYHRSILSVIDK